MRHAKLLEMTVIVPDQQLTSISVVFNLTKGMSDIETELETGNELLAVNFGSAEQMLGLVRDLLDSLQDGINNVRLGQALGRDASDQRFGVSGNERVGEQQPD